MTVYKAIADFSACYKANRKMPSGSPCGIVVHSTGANNPNLKRYVNFPELCGENPYKNYFGGPNSNDVTPHAVVGKDKNGEVKAVQILPYDICCWGCGNGSKGSYNYSPAYIQFEICEDGLSDSAYFEKAFDVAAQYCAELMKQFPAISLSNVVSHKEAGARGYASGHGDPENWLSKFGKNMDWFREKVRGYLGQPAPAIPEITLFKEGDTVEFVGSTHYTGSTSTRGTSCKPGRAKITRTALGTAHPYHLVAENGGGSTVYGWVNADDVRALFSPYTVKVATDALNIRSGPGTNYTTVGTVGRGEVYTVVEESPGLGASKWGKLKSGAGWIALDYVNKV